MQGKNIMKYLKLIIIFLDEIHSQGTCFQTLAEYFESRLLYSKSKICSLFIFLFISFVFNSRLLEANSLLKINLLSVLDHIKAWFCSTFAIKVPHKNISFAHRLQDFGAINRKVCDVALIALKSHIRHFSGHLALLDLFSDIVFHETKADMEAEIAHSNTSVT